MRQYFSLYRAVSQTGRKKREKIDERKNVQTSPTRTYCKSNRPLPYYKPKLVGRPGTESLHSTFAPPDHPPDILKVGSCPDDDNSVQFYFFVLFCVVFDLFYFLNLLLSRKQQYLWCTKRVKSTDTGRPAFLKYGSPRKNTGRPVNIRVDPYFTGLLAFTGRPVIYGSTRILRVDPYLKYGSTRKYTGLYGSTRILRVYLHLRVDP